MGTGSPGRVAGTSLGARVVQELALSRPHLLSHAVMMAAHERPPPVQSLLATGERALHDAGIELPSSYYVASLMIGFADDLMLPPQLAREWEGVGVGRRSPTPSQGVYVPDGARNTDHSAWSPGENGHHADVRTAGVGYQTMVHPNGSVSLMVTGRPATRSATAFSRSWLVIVLPIRESSMRPW